jgi:hypothetical protein
VEDLARLVLEEDAGARHFIAHVVHVGKIVERLAALLVLLGEGDVVVEVEIAAERRHPLESQPMRLW